LHIVADAQGAINVSIKGMPFASALGILELAKALLIDDNKRKVAVARQPAIVKAGTDALRHIDTLSGRKPS